MGIDYCLYKCTGEKYELGTGDWDETKMPLIKEVSDNRRLFRIWNIYPTQLSLFKDLLGNIAPAFSREIRIGYFYDLTIDIFQWAGDDLIEFWVDDEFFSAYFSDSKVTRSRYRIG